MSGNEALKQTVMANNEILAALIAAVRKKDALDLTLFNQLIETMRAAHMEKSTDEQEYYNRVIEAAKSACLIRDQQPQGSR